jgi:hypothetical protein
MIVYKVWVEIEEYDTDTEHGETVPLLDIPCSGTYATAELAKAAAEIAHESIINNLGQVYESLYPDDDENEEDTP